MPKEPLPGVQSIQGCLNPTSSPIEDYMWLHDLQNLWYLPYKDGEIPLSERTGTLRKISEFGIFMIFQ